MSNIFVTSDSHYLHKNIITYCERPFSSVNEMNEILVQNWNSVIKSKNDIVYHLGDFGFWKGKDFSKLEKILSRLNGTLYLIKGNHDLREIRDFSLWKGTFEYKEIRLREKICMMHYPIEEWNGCSHGSIMLHEHVHLKNPSKNPYKIFDVGVDANNFTQVHINTILESANSKNNKPFYGK